MPEPIDMSQDEYLRQRPRSAAEEFGEDVTDPGYAYDDGPPNEPAPSSSAARFGARRKRHEAEAAQQQRQDTAMRMQSILSENYALHEAGRMLDAGQDVPDDLMATAARAAARQGLLPRQSSAARLAGPTLARLRRPPQEQDQEQDNDRRRREGRRPRS